MSSIEEELLGKVINNGDVNFELDKPVLINEARCLHDVHGYIINEDFVISLGEASKICRN